MSSTTVRNVLSNIVSFKLFQFLEAEYTTRGLTDAEFAKEASQKIGCTILESNVLSTRQSLNIESRRERLRREAAENAPEKVDKKTVHELTVQVAELERRMKNIEEVLARDGLGATLASMFPAATVMDARANGKALSIYG